MLYVGLLDSLQYYYLPVDKFDVRLRTTLRNNPLVTCLNVHTLKKKTLNVQFDHDYSNYQICANSTINRRWLRPPFLFIFFWAC